MQVRSLGQDDPLEKEMATHSSILSWRIPWTEEPGEVTKSQIVLKRLSRHAQSETEPVCNPDFNLTQFHQCKLQCIYSYCSSMDKDLATSPIPDFHKWMFSLTLFDSIEIISQLTV